MPPILIQRSRLKPLLRSRGKTQRWLADQINFPFQRINDYANDRRPMPIEIAANCARVLDCKIEDLFIWKEVSLSEWQKWIESRRRKE